MVQLAQLILACRAWRSVGRPVATMVPSRDDMNRAIEQIPKISHGAALLAGAATFRADVSVPLPVIAPKLLVRQTSGA
jgi:hypothetical protein